MRAPSPASVLVLLASIAFVLASRVRAAPDRVTIDRSFLIELHRAHHKLDGPGGDDGRFADLVFHNAEELHYLVRTDDPLATAVAMRIIVRGRISANDCACFDPRFDADLCVGGVPGAFWSELGAMSPDDQLTVIRAIDQHGYTENAASTSSEADRDAFMKSRPELHRRYAGTIAETVVQHTDK